MQLTGPYSTFRVGIGVTSSNVEPGAQSAGLNSVITNTLAIADRMWLSDKKRMQSSTRVQSQIPAQISVRPNRFMKASLSLNLPAHIHYDCGNHDQVTSTQHHQHNHGVKSQLPSPTVLSASRILRLCQY